MAKDIRKKAKRKSKKKPTLSRTHKPETMSLEDWQIGLRKQFARTQSFHLVNRGEHPVFSEFHVTNPAGGNTYKVRIRGRTPGSNSCTCPDFTTNTLGTCKHIEFTLAKLERKTAFRRQLREGYQAPNAEIYLQYGSRREVHFRPGSDTAVDLVRLAANTFDELGALRPEAVASFHDFLSKASEIEPDIVCHEDVLAFVAELRDAAHRQEQVDKAFAKGIRSAAFRNLLKVNLYDYQRAGALFAAKAGRAIIGDEMGLGKTIQAIASAEIMAKLFGVERVLIICPTSLKHQWQREIERFTDRSAQVIGGMLPQRHKQFAEAGTFFKITNYDTVYRDVDCINAWSPDLVILDEAQRIKNWTTRVARSVKKVNSPHAIVLTGTPLENRLEELVSIVQFVDLFRLGPTFRLLDRHQIRDKDGKVVGYRELDSLGQTLEPILIRRQKSQVLQELPGRIDQTIFVPMTAEQQAIHSENAEIVAKVVHKWRRYKFLSEADQRRLMIALQNMRMVCDSTYLLEPSKEFGNKPDEIATLLGEFLERPEVKVVVFSQWVRMHELIINKLKQNKIGHVFFHGGVPSVQRKGLIDKFRDDPDCRVFLSTDAGGVGLNLQHANVVINCDLPWNPAVLEQRIGRVHRLGQQQPVQVVNFVAKSSIEEGMLGLLAFKTSLFKGILDGGEKEIFLGGSRLNRFMESVEKATTAIPAPEIEEPQEPEESTPTPEATEEVQPRTEPQQPPSPTGGTTTPEVAIQPWAGLIETGLSLLQQLAANSAVKDPADKATPSKLIQRDEATGESYLRLPVPPPQVIHQAVSALQQWLQSMQS